MPTINVELGSKQKLIPSKIAPANLSLECSRLSSDVLTKSLFLQGFTQISRLSPWLIVEEPVTIFTRDEPTKRFFKWMISVTRFIDSKSSLGLLLSTGLITSSPVLMVYLEKQAGRVIVRGIHLQADNKFIQAVQEFSRYSSEENRGKIVFADTVVKAPSTTADDPLERMLKKKTDPVPPKTIIQVTSPSKDPVTFNNNIRKLIEKVILSEFRLRQIFKSTLTATDYKNLYTHTHKATVFSLRNYIKDLKTPSLEKIQSVVSDLLNLFTEEPT
ncbi:BA75_00805T0 [Komagataella pastoris]|uniref:BA75_00805T0 n=1 Tax=Komagataella pastoris TaxID=4922 RepID=A0A1B2J679_PICPA|nr:BA75_00805T0 [Komagataella pastoris]